MFKKTLLRTSLAGAVLAGVMAPAGAAIAGEISDAELYFELNATDGDLGFHGKIGADPWTQMLVFNQWRNLLFDLKPASVLSWEGMSEVTFESAEPPFSYLPPESFFARYPEGDYLVVGIPLYGHRMDRTVPVSHLMPSPPVTFVNNVPAAEDCDEQASLPEFTADDVVVHWEEVTHSHPTIGRINEPMAIKSYEVVIEVPEADWKSSALLPPGSTAFEIPDEVLALAEEGLLKYEVIARGENNNQTAVESCFLVDD